MREKLLKEVRKRRKPSGSALPSRTEQLPEVVDVLVAPYIFMPVSHSIYGGKGTSLISAVWLPAKLHPGGELQARLDFSPWIARELLEPSTKDELIIGTLEGYLQHLEEQRYQGASWAEALAFINALFQKISKQPLDQWQPRDFRRTKGRIMLAPEDRDAKGKILALCKRWLERDTLPVLLKRALGTVSKPVPVSLLDEPVAEKSHVGHIGAYPLNYEQRDVVRCTMQLGPGELLAVNGPPGTGKTTVLQGVMASLIVQAALLGKQEPSIILATSTNNQAVTNIIDSFAKTADTEKKEGILYRWLADVRGLGVRIPSAWAAQREAGKYQNFDDLRQGLFDQKTLKARTRHYLDCFCAWRKTPRVTVAQAVDILRQELRATVAPLETFATLLPGIADLHRRYPGTVEEKEKTIEAALQEQRQVLRRLEEERRRQEHTLEQLITEETHLPWYWVLLSFIPHIRLYLARRLSISARSRGIDAISLEKSYPSPGAVIEEATRWYSRWYSEHEPKEKQARRKVETLQKDASTITQYARTLHQLQTGGEAFPDAFNFEAIKQSLDISSRQTAFHLAMRYWEGVFLTTAHQWEASWAEERPGQKESSKTALLRTMAMVTPCFVATVYKAADLFAYYDGQKKHAMPLQEIIDLLIFDESGQVGTEIGLPLLGLAKRALVVGDVEQLKPISVSEVTDIVRLTHNQIDREAMTWLDTHGLSCARGNVMRAAHPLTAFTDTYGTPGIMLRDHYRCLPDIIGFCNDFVYQGLLRPKRLPERTPPLPALGYAHIRGEAERDGSSWRNRLEAQTIAQWLQQQQRALRDHYPQKKLHEIVAVVTPYRSQAQQIRQELRKTFPLEIVESLTVDTVYTLQGAERDIVIFSPTVRAHQVSLPLQDRDRSILNVAVSRAKDAFLVLGDMELFRQDHKPLPSSILARRLYNKPENQLVNIFPSFGLSLDTKLKKVLLGLADHQQLLFNVLEQAQEKILICSPFIRSPAVEANGLLMKIRACVARGVKLIVATDETFDEARGGVKENARVGRNQLHEAGATVWVIDKIHAKTLCMDRQILVEGSFNWLSATRDPAQARLERSLISHNEEKTAYYIEDAWKEIENKPRSVWNR